MTTRKGPPATPIGPPEQVRMVPLRELVRNPAYQVRARLDPGHVDRYANVLANGGTLPPIQAALIGGALVLVDGWHRVAAHERRGLAEVPAVVVPATASEARWLAAQANLMHGLPLKPREIRTAFRALIRARQHVPERGRLRSYRELTGMLGGTVRHTTVSNWMRADFPEIARRMAEEDPGTASREAKRDDEGEFFQSFGAAVDTARANARGVRDPGRRGDMIGAVRGLLRDLEQGGKWVEDEF